MKNLKKFQEFALTQEEQKNVKGGRRWKCTVSVSPKVLLDTFPIEGDQAAVNYCNSVSNCVGCYVMGEGQ